MERMEWSEFLQIINGDQSRVKYVIRVTNSQSYTSKIVELANESGGKLIIGFDRNTYQIIGVPFDASWLEAVIDKECKPQISFTIGELIRNRNKIYVVDIKEGNEKPYSSSEAATKLPEIQQQNITSFDNEIKNHSKSKKEDTKKYPSETDFSFPDTRLTDIRIKNCLDFLKENKSVTNSQYRDLNGVSHKTAHNELSHLVKEQLLEQVGHGRTTKYVLFGYSDNYNESDEDELDSVADKINSLDNEQIFENNEISENETYKAKDKNSIIDNLSKNIEDNIEDLEKNITKYNKIDSIFSNINENDIDETTAPFLNKGYSQDRSELFEGFNFNNSSISITDVRRSLNSELISDHIVKNQTK